MDSGLNISVLLATYNGARYLAAQLDSLLAQTMTDWHCYIHDDGSTDGTQRIIEDYCRAYPDYFTVLYYPATGSAGANFMSLLNSADGDYVMFCDQDDVWLPGKIEKTYELMRQTEAGNQDLPAAVYADMKVVKEDLEVISESFMRYSSYDPEKICFERLLLYNEVPGCVMMMNRRTADLASNSNLENIWMHDWFCALIAEASGRLSALEEPVMLYRQHGDNELGAAKKITPVRRVFEFARDLLGNDLSAKYLVQRKQAMELASVETLTETEKKLCRDFFYLDELSVPERFHFCRKYLKYGFLSALECSISAQKIL